MKRFISSVIVFVGLCTYSYAQKLSKEQAKADFQFCYDALKTAHPSVYRYTKADEFNNIFKFLDARIQDSMYNDELGELVNILVSTTRCVHTSASNSLKAKSTEVFNFSTVIYQNKLYARGIKEYSSDTTLYRILSINKVPASEIVDRLLMLRSGDGYNQNFVEAYLSVNFNAFFNTLYTVPKLCPIVIQVGKTEKEIIVDRQKKYSVKNSSFNWDDAIVMDTMQGVKLMRLKNVPSTRILRVKTFKKYNASFYTAIFAGMEKDSIQQIVLDLRGNTGGNIYHAFYLLNHFIDRDIYMYTERRKSKITPYLSTKGKFQWALGKLLYDVNPLTQRWNDSNGLKYYRYSFKTKNTTHYTPKVVVLTDGLTVSSGSLVAAYMKYYYKAQVIGTESGGTYTGNNGRSFPEVQLPNSKIKVRLPLFYINYFPGVPDYGRGVAVDYEMSPLLNKKAQEDLLINQLINNVE